GAVDGIGRALPAAAVVGAHTYLVTAVSRGEVSGASARLPAATLAGTGALAAAVLAGRRNGAGRPAGGVASLLTGSYLRRFATAQALAVREPGAAQLRAAVSSGITSLPMLQGALTARAGRPLAGLIVAAAAPLGRRLARRISPT
ncbi:MAG TPA: 4-hydroxybenzoate polyprenyltransferase, partial [Actinoplanes sp.]|nr:4-hydroxybenzoate polyprenyltransferase [Actinoplanes sp.]